MIHLGCDTEKSHKKDVPQPKPKYQVEHFDQNEIKYGVSLLTKENLKKHVDYLASPELEGRRPGRPGERIASDYIEHEFQSIGLQPTFDRSYRQPFPIEKNAALAFYHHGEGKISLIDGSYRGTNISGYIEGSDPILKKEIVVIGAHFDHLGVIDGELFSGADDNASGVAALIEIAKAFKKSKFRLKRTLIFLAFSGEEFGLAGSKYYVEHPSFPIENVSMMINMDMIGNGRGKVQVFEYKNSIYAKKRLNHSEHLYPVSVVKGKKLEHGTSDHKPFVDRGIPSLMFYTGHHDRYHSPKDTPNLVDYNTLHNISSLVFDSIYKNAMGIEK